MEKNILFGWIFTVVIVLIAVIYFGCQENTDAIGAKDNPITETKTQDITGKWTGVFDGKNTVLDITKQTDSSFSGIITISYSQPINQEVMGAFSPSTLKMTMTDQIHSRFQGEYSGSLSKGTDNFSGTFTLNNDGSKYSFDLNKNKGG